MPRLGVEPIRRDALVKATIAEIARAGSLDVTVAQIARRAGMSPALAHHYFGGKEDLFLASMRHVLSVFGADVRLRLKGARTPRERLGAVIAACFAEANFDRDTIAAWLSFFVLAQTRPEVSRLLRVYQRRLGATLRHDLRRLVAPRAAEEGARILAALIDGFYLRAALGDGSWSAEAAEAEALINVQLDRFLEAEA